MKKVQKICGTEMELMYGKVKKLNLELAKDELGCPAIIFQDWTGKSKDLFRLHLKEANELKSVIDNLILDYLWKDEFHKDFEE